MPKFEIIPGRLYHCGIMARRARREHLSAVAASGLNAHQELRARFYESAFCKAWLIDGRLAALGGVTGSSMSPYGYVWLAIAETATRYPTAIVREAKKQLEELMETRNQIFTLLVPDDDAAERFAIFLGFQVERFGPGSAAYFKFGRKNLAKFVKSNTDLRVPLGNRYAIPVFYEKEVA